MASRMVIMSSRSSFVTGEPEVKPHSSKANVTEAAPWNFQKPEEERYPRPNPQENPFGQSVSP